MNTKNSTEQQGAQGPAMTRSRSNQRKVFLWSLLWALSWLAVTWALSSGRLPLGAPGIVAAVLSSSLGIGTVWAYRRFLNGADEVQRKIELEALALAFGVAVVGGMAYWLLERSGALPVSKTDLLDVLAVALLTYSAGVLLGKRRYA